MKQLFSSIWLQTEQGCEPGEKGNTESVVYCHLAFCPGALFTLRFRGVELMLRAIYTQAFIWRDGSEYKKSSQYLLF